MTCNGEVVQGFESQKALALLGYLAAQNHAVPRDRLVGLFWGDKSQSRGRGNLRRVLHNLNQILSGCLETDRYVVRLLRSPACWCDIDVFAQIETEADPSKLSQALDRYRGDFMEGLYLDDCPEFETWLTVEQERWRQRAAQAFDTLVAHHSQRGESRQALKFARRLLALTPWRESTHRQVMALLARAGQRAEALRQYGVCCQMLADEFGVEPAEETVSLYRRICAAETRPRFQLPARTTPFVGRKRELAEISHLLASPDCRLLTLLGLGGIGKTRLALQYARLNQDIFLDGVAFIPLAAVEDPNRLIPALAQALKIDLAASPTPRVQLFDYLRQKEILLLLDNFEHLLDSATLLSDLLNAAPQLKLLVTSRERLHLQGEWVFPLGGLSLDPSLGSAETPAAAGAYPPASIRPQEEAKNSPPAGGWNWRGAPEAGGSSGVPEAAALFIQRARQADYGFRPDENIPQICQLLEGIPLGIELAAALVSQLSCEQIAAQIRTGLDGLASCLQDIPERHRSLGIVFAHSWQMLSDQEQQVFRRLAVFQAGFGTQAAAHVASGTPEILRSLTDKALLRQVVDERYEMHEILRHYALEKLDQAAGESSDARDAHADYFLGLLAQWKDYRREAGSIEAQNTIFQHIDLEYDNIRTAWDWAVKSENAAPLTSAVYILGRYYEHRGWYPDGKKLFQDAIRMIRRPHTSDHARPAIQRALGTLLMWLGDFELNLGLYDAARENLSESVSIFRAANARFQLAWATLMLGQVIVQKGDLATAESHYRESLRLFQTEKNINGEAVCLEFLGTISSIQGKYQAAKEFYSKSLQRYRQSNDSYGTAGGLYCLGDIARISGDFEAAQTYFAESLDLYQDIKSQRGVAQALNQLGNICRLLGQHDQALQHHRQSLELRQEIGERDGIAISRTNMGLDAYEQGDFAQSKTFCQQGLALFREIDHKRGVVFALIHLGKAHFALDEYQSAKDILLEAVNLAVELESHPQVMEALVWVASLMAEEGDEELALQVAACPLEDPATYKEVREQAQKLVARLKADLHPERAAQIMARGRQRDPEAVLKILRSA